MDYEHDAYGAPIDPTVNRSLPLSGRGPQPPNQRTTTRAAKALLDPTLSSAELDGYAAKLRAEAKFQQTMMNAGIGAATAPVAELAAPVAEYWAGANYARLSGSLARAGRAPLSGGPLRQSLIRGARNTLDAGGSIAGSVADVVLDPASAMGFGKEESDLADQLSAKANVIRDAAGLMGVSERTMNAAVTLRMAADKWRKDIGEQSYGARTKYAGRLARGEIPEVKTTAADRARAKRGD